MLSMLRDWSLHHVSLYRLSLVVLPEAPSGVLSPFSGTANLLRFGNRRCSSNASRDHDNRQHANKSRHIELLVGRRGNRRSFG